MFLNITPTVTNWTSDNKQFSLIFDENPLADFVELPDDSKAQNELWYSNILCGVLRGALEMVSTLMRCLVGHGRHWRCHGLLHDHSAISIHLADRCAGKFEQVQMQVDTHFASDVLRGNDSTEMRVSLIRIIDDELPPGED